MVIEPRSASERELRRELRRPQVLAIVVGAIVGSGIYIRAASIAQQLESPSLLLAVWLAGGILSLCGALTYAQLAMRIPGTGGEYLFLRTTLGRLPAFLYGWTLFLLGTGTLIAASVARRSPEVLTAVALIASGIPIFAVLGLLRSSGSHRSVKRIQ